MDSNWSYSPETLNLGKNGDFLPPCDLEIWQMTLKSNRAPLLCCYKLCASFHSHCWTTVTDRKLPNWGKIYFDLCDLDLCPLTLTFCMNTTNVNGNNSWKFRDDPTRGTLWKRCHRRTDRRTDGRTDGRTNRQTDGRTEVFLELLDRS